MSFLRIVVLFRRGPDALERLLLSVEPAACPVLLIDTGPDDEDDAHRAARLVAERHGDVYPYRAPKEVMVKGRRHIADFSAARDFAHSLVGTPWSLFLDSDDELDLRRLFGRPLSAWVEQIAARGYDAIECPYVYSRTLLQQRVRFFDESRPWVWKGRIHEERHLLDGSEPRIYRSGNSGPVVLHHGDEETSAERNKKIMYYWEGSIERWTANERLAMASAILQDPEARWHHYTADARYYAKDLALRVFQEEAASPQGVRAALLVSSVYCQLLRYEKAILVLGAALEANPAARPLHLELARIYARAEAWGQAADRYRRAMSCPGGETSQIVDDMEFRLEAARVLFRAGDLDGTERLLTTIPRSTGEEEVDALRVGLRLARARSAWDAFQTSYNELSPRDQGIFPVGERGAPSLRSVEILAAGPVAFGPRTHLTGPLGGSEQAVAHLAPLLQEEGRDVLVWRRSDGWEGSERGAAAPWWGSFEDFDPRPPHPNLIVWRDDGALPRLAALGCEPIFWSHDVPAMGRARNYLAARKVVALSWYHRQLFLDLFRSGPSREALEEKVVVLGNGVVDDLPPLDESRRNPRQLVYASSAVRGLGLLLASWPRIRERVPDATLKVLYPLDLLERPSARLDQRRFARRIREEAPSLASQGVDFLGGVSHPRLVDILLESGALAYPCIFPEVWCIIAAEAQAMGCVPVVPLHAALAETVFWQDHAVDPIAISLDHPGEVTDLDIDYKHEKALGPWLDSLVSAMLDPPSAQERARAVREARERFSWRKMAKRFIEELGL